MTNNSWARTTFSWWDFIKKDFLDVDILAMKQSTKQTLNTYGANDFERKKDLNSA